MALASVVPPLTEVMSMAVRNAFAREPLVVGPGLKTGISVLYENPREVGADRIVNAVAAHERVRGPVIVLRAARPLPEHGLAAAPLTGAVPH